MPHSYSSETNSLIWIYPESPARWVFVLIALAAFIGLSIDVASDVFAPSDATLNSQLYGWLDETSLWLNVAGMVLSAGLFLILVRPPVSGSFMVRGSLFELDSGRKPADLLGYIAGYYEGIRHPLGFLKAKTSPFSMPQQFMPKRIRFNGNLAEITGLDLKSGDLGVSLVFAFRGKEYEFAQGLPGEELADIHSALKRMGVLSAV
jgi:hypothetical protein